MLANLNRESSFEKVGFIVNSFKPSKSLTMSPSGLIKVSNNGASSKEKQWEEPEEEEPEWLELEDVDQEQRMRNYLSLVLKKTWNSISPVLTGMIDDKLLLAMAVNDIPESFRITVLN
jgi:hypothetical protein